MAIRSDRHLPILRDILHKRGQRSVANYVEKRATPGERVLSALFPNRGTGWPGGWSQDRLEQVLHMRNWTYVAINTILCKLAAVDPNMAYVSDVPIPGRTEKAGYRSLTSIGAYGSSGFIGGESIVSKGRAVELQNGVGVPHVGFSDGGHSYLTMGAYRSKALSVVKPTEELEPVEYEHRLRQLMASPNPWDTSFDLFYELEMFEELCGVSYLWVIPSPLGMPAEMWVLPAHWVWPRTGGGRYIDEHREHADELVEYYEVRPWGGMGSAGILKLPPDEVIMFRWKSPINKIDGYARLAAIAQWIDSEESISKSRWSQFQNQARPEFWVELGPGYESPDDDEIQRIKAKFRAEFQGEYNYGNPVITPSGAKVTPLSFSPTEMAYFQSEDQLRDMILSTFGVPRTAIGISEGMTYGSVLGTLAGFCQFCLNPRFARLGQTLTKHLASRWDEDTSKRSWSYGTHSGGRGGRRRVKLWWDDCVPADPQMVNSDLGVDGQHYAVTPNEVRAIRGRKSYAFLGDAPLYQGPGGLTPLPVNTGMDDEIERLAKLIAPMSQQGGEEQGAGGVPGMPGGEEVGGMAALPPPGGEEPAGEEGLDLDALMAQGEQDELGVANPNAPPTKKLKQVVAKMLKAGTADGDNARELASTILKFSPKQAKQLLSLMNKSIALAGQLYAEGVVAER